MEKKYRIKRKSEIDALFKGTLKRGNSYFTIYVKEQVESANFRFAMSIGRKFGNAVERNKIKRQIRSIIREQQKFINKRIEFVIVIKPQASGLSFEQINKEIVSLLNRLKIMERLNEDNK